MVCAVNQTDPNAGNAGRLAVIELCPERRHVPGAQRQGRIPGRIFGQHDNTGRIHGVNMKMLDDGSLAGRRPRSIAPNNRLVSGSQRHDISNVYPRTAYGRNRNWLAGRLSCCARSEKRRYACND